MFEKIVNGDSDQLVEILGRISAAFEGAISNEQIDQAKVAVDDVNEGEEEDLEFTLPLAGGRESLMIKIGATHQKESKVTLLSPSKELMDKVRQVI